MSNIIMIMIVSISIFVITKLIYGRLKRHNLIINDVSYRIDFIENKIVNLDEWRKNVDRWFNGIIAESEKSAGKRRKSWKKVKIV